MIKPISKSIIFLFLACAFCWSDSISIIVVGDIMMGSDYPAKNLPPDNGQELFNHVAAILIDADLTLGNLEGTLLTGGVSTKKIKKGRCYAFRTPPEWAANLANAGFDFMNMANNHMNDFGAGGIQGTEAALTKVGLQYGGAYEKMGKFDLDSIKVVIISFSTSPNTNSIFDITETQKLVAEQAKLNDIVIVSFHAGAEGRKFLHTRDTFEYFLGNPRGNVVEFAHAVIDKGADFVWGHGPHVPRAMEIYKDRLIAYSMGNFCTMGFNLTAELGYAPILKINMDPAGAFKSGEIISARQTKTNGLTLDSLDRAATLIRKLSEQDFPGSMPVFINNKLYPGL